MRESIIEAYLRDEVKKIKGKAYKFVSPGNTGVPDRLVLLPEGRAIFIELKGTGKKPTEQQLYRQKIIRGFGFEVFNIDSKDLVDEFIREVMPK